MEPYKMNSDITVQKAIGSCLPARIWQFKRIRGSLLSIDCGEKYSSFEWQGETYSRGSFALTIYLCNWKFCEAEKALLTSDDTLEYKYDWIAEEITGLNIISIIEIIPRRKIVINLQDNLLFILQQNNKAYGYRADMIFGFINQNAWGYSPTKRFYWDKK